MASLTSAPMTLARVARPIHGEDELDQLLDLVAGTRIVMLGAGSYGTHEHYDLRASLTRKLIRERGFSAVAIEADWSDALRIDRYVRNQSDDDTPLDAFLHFPSWVWRNEDVSQFVDWLRIQNCCRPAGSRVGFYGLDVFSLNASIRAIRSHGDVGDDELIAELVDMQWRRAARSGRAPSGNAWLHAMPQRAAESYYRTMLTDGDEAWNLRSVHMADTLDMIARHVGSENDPAKIVVWAHNSHVGDARAAMRGRNSLGQLMRERHPDEVALVGFTTHTGTVRCSGVERLSPSDPESWEGVFHEIATPRFMITASALRRAIDAVRLHREVGIVMRDTYFDVRLADHYDVVIHVDTTRAVEPLVIEEAPAETRAMLEATP